MHLKIARKFITSKSKVRPSLLSEWCKTHSVSSSVHLNGEGKHFRKLAHLHPNLSFTGAYKIFWDIHILFRRCIHCNNDHTICRIKSDGRSVSIQIRDWTNLEIGPVCSLLLHHWYSCIPVKQETEHWVEHHWRFIEMYEGCFQQVGIPRYVNQLITMLVIMKKDHLHNNYWGPRLRTIWHKHSMKKTEHFCWLLNVSVL